MRKENGIIVCNCCGKNVEEPEKVLKQDFFHGEKAWGYFSEKDGEKQEFDICEECYDKWTASFQIPVQKREVTEFV